MKCQKCDRVATFHITEMIDAEQKELHFCDFHATEYLHRNESLRSVEPNMWGSAPSKSNARHRENVELAALTEELETSDFQVCPYCGAGFQEFRKSGALGCPNDYVAFRERLEPLMFGMHGALEHKGKRPSRRIATDRGAALVQLRSELADAIETEDYELASTLRDKIAELTAKKGTLEESVSK